MALGKNLKKQKLIDSDKKDAKKPKKVVKKKLIADKKGTTSAAKKTISTKATTRPSRTKKSQVTKKEAITKKIPKTAVQETSKWQSPFESELPVYIAKELQELKNSLRERYNKEIAAMAGHTIQFVVVQIGTELYAIDIDIVKEVVPSSELSKTPNTPSHILGIANVRGSTYVVFDLTKKFKLEGEFDTTYLLVVERGQFSAALSLSSLPTTRKISGDNVSSDLHMIENASLDVSYIKGLIQDQDQLIYYLDVVELIKNDKAIVVPDKLVEEKG